MLANRPTSNYRGVSWNIRYNKWHVVLWDSALKKNIGVGYYDEEMDAARAYDREAIKRKLFNKLDFYNSPELLADG